LEAARKKFKMQIVRLEFYILSLRGLFFLAPGQHPANEPAISHQSVKQHLRAAALSAFWTTRATQRGMHHVETTIPYINRTNGAC
jgi:hypothetical protein